MTSELVTYGNKISQLEKDFEQLSVLINRTKSLTTIVQHCI